jgi:DNA gyrase subunit A
MVVDIGKVKPIEIIQEMQKSYLDYAMSVIVMRALPDVRDGLKPVHRRILYAMDQMNLAPGGRYTKSAKVVGEVLGKYHPHGDSSVYEALVRMAQRFSMRYTLTDGQGNFGSIDGDPPAAMRYTEARLAKISKEMLDDLQKETVDFDDNFDGTLKEPHVLPAKIPNLLLNGTDGIAVGMATKIPPHNLKELLDASLEMLKNSRLEKEPEELEIRKIEIDKDNIRDIILKDVYALEREKFNLETDTAIEDLLKIVKGPDFPTAGIIFDKEQIISAYTTGKGKIPIRGKADIKETKGGKFQIIITELPYQVNKANMVAKIADLARDKKLTGISDLRDESDRDGIRVVVDLKKNAVPKSVLNKLYKLTELQTSYPVNIVALVDGVPQTLNLRQILLHYLRFRHEVIRKRTFFDLKEAKIRSHILEGLIIALDNLDEVIKTIRNSTNAETARENLIKKFSLTILQANAILDMQLRKLAALERQKIEAEYKEIKNYIDGLMAILTDKKVMIKTITDELIDLKSKYADERKTKVVSSKVGQFTDEDLIPNDETILTLTKTGYIKRVPKETFRTQRRGGKGIMGMTQKEEDEIEHMLFAETHDYLLVFTDRGRVFQLRVWEIPETGRQSKGQAIINLINIDQNERIKTILIRKNESEQKYVIMTTSKGLIKKTSLNAFKNIRSSGIIAINMRSKDELIDASLSDGKNHILMITQNGKCIRFAESDVRPMGRTARGVKGINIKSDDQLVSANVIPDKLPTPVDKRKRVFKDLLIVSENGIGKRTNVFLFPLQKRGGMGVKASNVSAKTGKIADAKIVDRKIKQVIITTKQAQVIKLPLRNIPRLGRATQGVILMRLGKGSKDQVATITAISETSHEEIGKKKK